MPNWFCRHPIGILKVVVVVVVVFGCRWPLKTPAGRGHIINIFDNKLTHYITKTCNELHTAQAAHSAWCFMLSAVVAIFDDAILSNQAFLHKLDLKWLKLQLNVIVLFTD